MPFWPGLVGGHCIGVDPCYLTFKAQSVGYHPEIILAGRRLDDGMGAYISVQLVKALLKKLIRVQVSCVLVMGLTFKEDCPDIRNTRVVDIVQELKQYGANVECFNPWVEPQEAVRKYGIEVIKGPEPGVYDVIILSVAHAEFV